MTRLFTRKHVSRIATIAIFTTLLLAMAPAVYAAGNAESDKYGGWTGIQGEKTGFFHLEKINGRHWFITPDGNGFFPVALSHLDSGESDVACQNVYGGDKDAWMEGSFAKARAMGFNCALGSATSPERNLNGFVEIPKVETLFRENNFPFSVGVILLKHPWEFVEGEDLPDIFDPAYTEMIEARAKAACPPVRDDPLVMGYYYGFGAFNHSEIWVNQYLSLPPGSHGRNAIVDVLIERYDNDVDKFNRVYDTSLKGIADLKQTDELVYDDLMERRNYPKVRARLDPRQVDDFEAILSHMAVTLYKIGYDAIRRWDTNHLIFGSFVKEFALSAESFKAAAPYMDMIAPQHINRDVSVHRLAAAANLPILISDEYFGFHYPGMGNRHAGLESHDARAEVYKANLMRHCKDPQVLGVTYCACMFDQGGATLKKNNQNGKLTDRLYEQLGKPIYNGDGSFSYAQPNQKEWGVKGWRTGAKSLEEVAEFYQETLEGMMAKPYIIGWHHCGYLEQWDAAERGDSPMNENGFMDPFENYHTEWTDVIREVNARASELHEAAN